MSDQVTEGEAINEKKKALPPEKIFYWDNPKQVAALRQAVGERSKKKPDHYYNYWNRPASNTISAMSSISAVNMEQLGWTSVEEYTNLDGIDYSKAVRFTFCQTTWADRKPSSQAVRRGKFDPNCVVVLKDESGNTPVYAIGNGGLSKGEMTFAQAALLEQTFLKNGWKLSLFPEIEGFTANKIWIEQRHRRTAKADYPSYRL